MTKSLEQFKTDTMGGRFGVPGTSNTNLGDPAYAGQCVSYVRLYMEEVLGIKTAVWGHAVNYWSNPSVLVYFDKVATPQDGDIAVWGDDEGSWTTEFGHIAIWYKGKLLNQNYGGNLKVTVNDHFTQGLRGFLRIKGGSTVNQAEVDKLWKAIDAVNKRLDKDLEGKNGLFQIVDRTNKKVDGLADSGKVLDISKLRIVRDE